jgi:hypothetical protein
MTNRKKTPPVPAYTKSVTRLAPVNARWRKISSGTIGCLERRSASTNATSPATPTARENSTMGSVPPRMGHAVKPYVRPPSPIAPVTMPATSM